MEILGISTSGVSCIGIRNKPMKPNSATISTPTAIFTGLRTNASIHCIKKPLSDRGQGTGERRQKSLNRISCPLSPVPCPLIPRTSSLRSLLTVPVSVDHPYRQFRVDALVPLDDHQPARPEEILPVLAERADLNPFLVRLAGRHRDRHRAR